MVNLQKNLALFEGNPSIDQKDLVIENGDDLCRMLKIKKFKQLEEE